MKNLFIILTLFLILFSCKEKKQKDKPITTPTQDTTITDDSKALMPPEGYDTAGVSMQRRRPKPPPSSTVIYLQGTGISPNQIKLSWQGGSPSFTVYQLLANRLNAVGLITTSAYTYTVSSGLSAATSYEFFIKDSGGRLSDTVKVTTLAGGGTGQAVLHLDFDGHDGRFGTWAVTHWDPSGLDNTQINSIRDSLQREYNKTTGGRLIVTTDEAVYLAANRYKRQREIYTVSWQWYGTAGGVASNGSFTSGRDDLPCFVFTSLLYLNTSYITRAGIHEAGHTFTLSHVPQGPFTSSTQPANWMGSGFYGRRGMFENPTSSGIYQINIINSKL